MPSRFAGEAYSNWELSADRANSARKIMQANGLRPEQVAQVRGFADRQFRHPDDPDGASNRRISVIVQYLAPPVLPEKPASEKPAEKSDKEPAPEPAKTPEKGK